MRAICQRINFSYRNPHKSNSFYNSARLFKEYFCRKFKNILERLFYIVNDF
nr:MAG TPA: hypothetical protein [Caudoviricetes sp.]